MIKGGIAGNLTPEESKLLLRHEVAEASFMAQIKQLARLNGWLYYHTGRSEGSDEGFFDVVMVHPRMRRIIFVEIKTEEGRLSRTQKEWREATEVIAITLATILVEVGKVDLNRIETWPVAYFEWRPSDWPESERVLAWRR